MLKRCWSFFKGMAGIPLVTRSRMEFDASVDPVRETEGFRDVVIDAVHHQYPLVLTVGAEREEYMIILPPGHQGIEYLYNLAAARAIELKTERG